MDDIAGANILIVDDALENLRILTIILKQNGYLPRPVTSGALAIEAAVADPPDLIILDLNMPQMSGLDVCRWFKQDERLKCIPVIFISGYQETEQKLEAFHVGGVDYISKPFHEQEVLVRIRTQLQLRNMTLKLITHNEELEVIINEQVKEATASQQATIFALARLAETRDDDTGQHIERVQVFSKVIAERMREMKFYKAQLTATFIENLYLTASLHDIGKVGTPDAVLLKPGKLNEEEFALMKKHCELGAKTLASVQKRFPDNKFLRMGVEVARSHQEMWDGNGYPDGLKETQIPLSARIVALADFYDALTNDRCYRRAVSHEETCKMIENKKGSHFDPDVTAAFLTLGNQLVRVREEIKNGLEI